VRKLTLADILPKSTLEDVIDFADEDEGVRYWERELNRWFNILEMEIGRKLSDVEWDGIIDIIEECSAKDGEGNIIQYFPLNIAWQMYLARGNIKNK
jgi:hypothetical protein